MIKITRGTEGLSALFSQEGKLGRKDSLLEKVVQGQDGTQRKWKCLNQFCLSGLHEE